MNNLLESLTIDPQFFIFAIINFVIAVVAFYFIALKPLGKTIKERKDTIEEGLKTAEVVDQKLKSLDDQVNAKLSEVEDKARGIINVAKSEGKRIKDEKLQEAKEESIQIINASNQKLGIDQKKMKAEMKVEIEKAVRKTLKEMMKEDVSLNQKLIDKAISKI